MSDIEIDNVIYEVGEVISFIEDEGNTIYEICGIDVSSHNCFMWLRTKNAQDTYIMLENRFPEKHCRIVMTSAGAEPKPQRVHIRKIEENPQDLKCPYCGLRFPVTNYSISKAITEHDTELEGYTCKECERDFWVPI